jgi:hypothetical protein
LVAISSVSDEFGWHVVKMLEAPTRVDGVQVAPYEPSTFTLALIGIGTIAMFLMVTGGLRRPRASAQPRRLINQFGHQPEVRRTDDKRSRGAA